MSNVALGKPIEEPITNPAAATDGQIQAYSDLEGFAEFSWPYMLTVDLGATYKLLCVRLLLWDGLGQGNKQRNNRTYKYRLLTSIDHLTWKVIYDASNDGGNGWQVFSFPNLLETRYVRIHGIWNSENAYFQVVQIEAHDSAPPDLDAEIMLQRTVLSESEEEIGDGMPLQARVAGIINRIERLIEENELLNPVPFRQLISQLRSQVTDVASLERGMDSIRREIITPVRHELQLSAKLNRFSVWGFWVGIVGGVLAIFSLALPIWQASRNNNNVQSNPVVASPVPASTPLSASDLENHNNAPSAFELQRKQSPLGISHFTRQRDMWVQEYPDRDAAQFPLAARIVLNGCIGSLLYRMDRVEVEEFVPDKGCGTMEVLIRIKRRRWESLGTMQNVR